MWSGCKAEAVQERHRCVPTAVEGCTVDLRQTPSDDFVDVSKRLENGSWLIVTKHRVSRLEHVACKAVFEPHEVCSASLQSRFLYPSHCRIFRHVLLHGKRHARSLLIQYCTVLCSEYSPVEYLIKICSRRLGHMDVKMN